VQDEKQPSVPNENYAELQPILCKDSANRAQYKMNSFFF